MKKGTSERIRRGVCARWMDNVLIIKDPPGDTAVCLRHSTRLRLSQLLSHLLSVITSLSWLFFSPICSLSLLFFPFSSVSNLIPVMDGANVQLLSGGRFLPVAAHWGTHQTCWDHSLIHLIDPNAVSQYSITATASHSSHHSSLYSCVQCLVSNELLC